MGKSSVKTRSDRRRIFLVDDHPVLRQGMGRLIDDQPDMQMCGEAESPPDALRLLASAKADVVIVDLTLRGGDGLELCKQIRDRWKELPILVVSMHDEALYAERALKAGAKGYVMKQEPQETVMTAIRTVAKGQVYLSAAMSAKLLQSFSGSPQFGRSSSTGQADGPGAGNFSAHWRRAERPRYRRKAFSQHQDCRSTLNRSSI